jgi:hypothetical protein
MRAAGPHQSQKGDHANHSWPAFLGPSGGSRHSAALQLAFLWVEGILDPFDAAARVRERVVGAAPYGWRVAHVAAQWLADDHAGGHVALDLAVVAGLANLATTAFGRVSLVHDPVA